MTNERSPEERRFSKFSNADLGYGKPPGAHDVGAPEPPLSAGDKPPLAELLEHVIREGALNAPAAPERSGQGLPSKLIEELKASRELLQAEPQVHRIDQEMRIAREEARALADRDTRDRGVALDSEGPDGAPIAASLQTARAPAAGGAKTFLRGSMRLARRVRPRDWRRRYLALLSLVHRHGFDRGTEKLLFSKTPPLRVYRITENAAGPQKTFVYEGPIPRKVLNWAFSALPADLKRYAFVDFHAGHGRTLLLAARHNFEFVCGYAYDTESCEVLELNLAQYPRSYMTCRDVRAVRGDRDGIAVPSQPAVLFLPDSHGASQLDAVLSHVSASYRLNPRPLYLIVDNAGRERGLEQMKIFEKAPLPILNRVKVFLFGPARIAVYRSLKAQSLD